MELTFHIPEKHELSYRKRITEDPLTMSYNKGYDLALPSYHKDTGCIDFPESIWDEWYDRFINRQPERFYAYIQSENSFVGEVCLRQTGDEIWDIGIVVENAYRHQGYGKAALDLLIPYAFETLGIPALHNEFEWERSDALYLHLNAGFSVIGNNEKTAEFLLTRKDYEEEKKNPDRLRLVPRSRELCHAFYQRLVQDPDLFADKSLFRPYHYDADNVNLRYDRLIAPDRYGFYILLEGAVIGDVGFKKIDWVRKDCVLGICLTDDSVKNRGYGTEAEKRILDFAFRHMGMRTVHADALLGNARSRRVLEKVGFRPIGKDDTFAYYRIDAE